MPESEMYFCSSINGLLGTGITVSLCFGAASFAFFLLETAPRPTEGADDGLEDCEVPVPELPLVRCFKLGVPGFFRWPASCYERAHCATVYFCPRSCTLAGRFGQHTRLRPPPCSSVNISGRVEQHAAPGKVLLVAVDSVYPVVQDAGSLCTAVASVAGMAHNVHVPVWKVVNQSTSLAFCKRKDFITQFWFKIHMRCPILNRLQTQQRGLVPAPAFTAAILTPSRVADER